MAMYIKKQLKTCINKENLKNSNEPNTTKTS